MIKAKLDELDVADILQGIDRRLERMERLVVLLYTVGHSEMSSAEIAEFVSRYYSAKSIRDIGD